MNKQEQLQKEIEELEAQLNHKRAQMNVLTDPLAPIPFPEDGVIHYWFDSNGVDSGHVWHSLDDLDRALHRRGLVSPNKSDIERIIAMQEQWGQFTLKAIQIADGWEPDWENRNKEKWYVYFDVISKKFAPTGGIYCMPLCTVCLPTENHAQQLADWANANVEVQL